MPKLAALILHQGSNTFDKYIQKQLEINSKIGEKDHVDYESGYGLVSPFPPVLNGIATYSHQLAEALKAHGNVIKISSHQDRKFRSSCEFTVSQLTEIQEKNIALIYMLGNGQHHWATFDAIIKYPGFIIVHDCIINDIPKTRAETERWMSDTSWENFKRIPLHTKGLIFHSHHAKNFVTKELSEEQKKIIPTYVLRTGHPISEPNQIVEEKLNFRVGTFGFQSTHKSPINTYTLMAGIASHFSGEGVIVGSINKKLERKARKIWRAAGNKKELRIVKNTTDERFIQELSQVNVGIQLRKYTNGESSGPVAQLLGHLIPVVISNLDAFKEIDAPLAFKIPGGDIEVDKFFLSEVIEWLTQEGLTAQKRALQKNWNEDRTYARTAEEITSILSNDYSA